ncbi:hypothetical protein TW84_21380 [Vibrio neptunius]|uniref:Nmad2 family putative nucleotide modification protein n=1 Tax=Vibrio neptunius TaxID=170651 RepID=UPI00061E5439|nr:hypothetical protein [Vibrio neptunius]KJY85654.1 hypothetical protein TW84_21380 [Vibrio neptunius]
MASKYYSYVIPRDYGFAPNPFGRECTLATCKPQVRKSAKVGDWVFGTSSIAKGAKAKIVFAMKVDKVTRFDDYYHAPEFQYKKPTMNGSLKKMYGDNIYHKEANEHGKVVWMQDDSHHSLPDGSPNPLNVKKDAGTTDKVLISSDFYYFGSEGVPIPESLVETVCKKGPGHRYVKQAQAEKLIDYIEDNFEQGINGDPTMFKNEFQRYNGK